MSFPIFVACNLRVDKVRIGVTKGRVIVVVLTVLLIGCAASPKGLFPPRANQPIRTIYLVSHGWHAGIVVRRADIPTAIWPEQSEFSGAEYLEVGWGDKEYYMTPEPHLGLMLKAGLLPTASVLHIVGFSGAVTRYFPHSEVIRLELSEAGFEQLCSYLANSYSRDVAGHSQALGPSLYGDGRFYLSRESYHAFNTCNVWTARGLRAAGCPVTPAFNLTVDTLMSHAAEFGTVIQSAPLIP
jgi:uncharacterized protein (TIGR02117 family)